MTKLPLTTALSSLLLVLSGCSSLWTEQGKRLCATNDGEFYECSNNVVITTSPSIEKDPTLFRPGVNFQTLGEYTEQMVHALKHKMSMHDIESIIAVPTFLSLAPYLPNQDKLTRDLPEFFITDFQHVGLPVAEYKLTSDDIVTNEDFIKLTSALKESQKFGYVLKGTIRANDHGVMVHVKVIDLSTDLIIASTSKLLPSYLIEKLTS